MEKITLKNMEFYAYHGCLEHEKEVGNLFFVSVTMMLDTKKAGETDRLENTVNYQEIYDLVAVEMNKPANLIENVVWRILNSLKKNIKNVEKWEVKLSKLAPPLGGKIEKVCIEIS